MPTKTTYRDPRILRRQTRPASMEDVDVLNAIRAAAGDPVGERRRVSVARHQSAYPPPLKWNVARLADIDFADSDLAGSRISPGLLRPPVQIVGCSFVNVDLHGSLLNHVDLRECRLEQTSLADARLTKAHVEDTNLKSVDLQGATFDRSKIRSSQFVNCRFDRTAFRGSNLVNSQFTGGAGFAVFVHSHVSQVDFSEATFDEMTFGECTLDGVTFPTQANWIAMRQQDFTRELRELLPRLSNEAREYLQVFARDDPRRRLDPWIVSRSFLEPAGNDAELVMSHLRPFAVGTYTNASPTSRDIRLR
jgi:uncharacterized protein YjbI with pentapeptide repeats